MSQPSRQNVVISRASVEINTNAPESLTLNFIQPGRVGDTQWSLKLSKDQVEISEFPPHQAQQTTTILTTQRNGAIKLESQETFENPDSGMLIPRPAKQYEYPALEDFTAAHARLARTIAATLKLVDSNAKSRFSATQSAIFEKANQNFSQPELSR